MSKTTCIEAMYKFYEVVITVFVDLYLREPIVATLPGYC
jgi:hypothetical protein